MSEYRVAQSMRGDGVAVSYVCLSGEVIVNHLNIRLYSIAPTHGAHGRNLTHSKRTSPANKTPGR